MKARTRSISGALMMLFIILMFARLLACMPEQARAVPDTDGLTYAPGDDDLIGK